MSGVLLLCFEKGLGNYFDLTPTNFFEIEQSEKSDWPKASKRRGMNLFSVFKNGDDFFKIEQPDWPKTSKRRGLSFPWNVTVFNVMVSRSDGRARQINSEATEHERFNF